MTKLPNILKKVTSLRVPKYGTQIRPVRDWLILLVVSAVLLIASAAWNALFFVNLFSEEASSAGVVPAHGPDYSSIDRATETFEAREREQERYKNEYRFVDPSR